MKLYIKDHDRFFIHQTVGKEKKLQKYLQIVSPSTVLQKWKDIIKKNRLILHLGSPADHE